MGKYSGMFLDAPTLTQIRLFCRLIVGRTQMPIMYISQNWPIKVFNRILDGALCVAFDIFQYATINATGHYIAIAGKRGLAHYSAVSNRWKLFGNEQQVNPI